MVAEIHRNLAYLVVGSCGSMGLVGVGFAIAKKNPPAWFAIARYVALGSALVQVSLGLIMYGQNHNPGSIHMFYGIVTLFTLAFAYIYRLTLARRPGLGWGLLLLFVMGLGIRGWMNYGQSF
ncbi:MAG: hypothetical protein JJE47_15055 [Acidimicrobiia bacterium]|nr:hypothetical protein [Acidimicrobiia bacterium]